MRHTGQYVQDSSEEQGPGGDFRNSTAGGFPTHMDARLRIAGEPRELPHASRR